MTYLYIVLGAAAGAPLRYFLQARVQGTTSDAFPIGTFVVNITGCIAIGLLAALTEYKGFLSREARLLLISGFLGSYTTFSAFGLEGYDLLRSGEMVRAGAYLVLSVVVGIAAVWASYSAVRALA